MSIAVVETAAGYCVDQACACHREPASACCPRCHRNGPIPLTVVPTATTVTIAEIEARIHRTRRAHGTIIDAFHQAWYDSGHTWAITDFLGVPCMKNPLDLWIYHELIGRLRPKTIVETGTYAGGSALWFAFLMDMLQIPDGRILTIDIDDHRQCQHPRITFLAGDSTDPELVAAVRNAVQHPLLVTLDADHSTAHVLKELTLYAPEVAVGEFLIVEDTNISWGEERGARGGVEDYLQAHPGEFRQDVLCEKHLLTCHPGGWLQRVAPCPH